MLTTRYRSPRPDARPESEILACLCLTRALRDPRRHDLTALLIAAGHRAGISVEHTGCRCLRRTA